MVQKEQYFSVCIYEKNLFGQDSKDSNVLILCPFLLTLLKFTKEAPGKGFLQSSQKYCHQAAHILRDFKTFSCV